MSWAKCPACRCITWDAAGHAQREAALAAALESLGLPTPDPVSGGPNWPGLPVPPLPTVDPDDATRAGTIRERADEARAQITNQALPALDAYLAVTPYRLPTVGEYRALVLTVRALAVAVRALIRLAVRALDATD